MPIQIIRPADRAAWLRARQKDITASTVGVLWGVHDFMTTYELWAIKTGRVARDDQESDAMRRGRLLEPVAVQIIREDYPRFAVNYSTDAQVYYRDPDLRLGATPDVIVDCPDRGRGIIQIKSVEAGVYRRKWLDEDGQAEAPLWIALQATLEAHLVGAEWAAVMPLVIGFGIEAPLVEIPLDHKAEIIARMAEASAEFWAMVDEDREPPIDFDRDAALIDRLYSVGDPREEADLTSQIEILDTIEAIKAHRDRLRAAEAAVHRYEAEIKAAMGSAEIAHIPGGQTIKWPTYRRRDPKTGATSVYRRLLLPR